jgi:hypothetical protein
VVVPVNATQTAASKQILRRVSVISGNIVHEIGAERHIILIPLNSTLGNKNAIHGIVGLFGPGCSDTPHLTTSLQGDTHDSFLERAVIALLPADSVELYHVSFSNLNFEQGCIKTGLTIVSDDALSWQRNCSIKYGRMSIPDVV